MVCFCIRLHGYSPLDAHCTAIHSGLYTQGCILRPRYPWLAHGKKIFHTIIPLLSKVIHTTALLSKNTYAQVMKEQKKERKKNKQLLTTKFFVFNGNC